MAQTEFKTLKGKGKWVKIYLPDDNFGDPAWKLDLYISPEDLLTFKSWGLKNRTYRDEDGDYVHLKRPVSKKWKGQEVNFTAPVVIDDKGNPFNQPIGNGSDLTVTLEYYGFNAKTGGGPGKAIRLHTVQVDNLVPSPYAQQHPKEINNVSPTVETVT